MQDKRAGNMDPSDLNITPPELIGVDISADGTPIAGALYPVPNPGLNGKRIRVPGDNRVYFVWQGRRCWVPNRSTYDLLFRSWEGIIGLDQDELNQISQGLDVTNGAVTAKVRGTAPVYLITNNTKNWIVSGKVMDYCNFRWPSDATVTILDHQVVLDSIPDGIPITYGD